MVSEQKWAGFGVDVVLTDGKPWFLSQGVRSPCLCTPETLRHATWRRSKS